MQTFEYVEGIESPTHLPEIILNKLKLEYRRYMICGGMPEAVVAMLNNHAHLPASTIMDSSSNYTEFKGAMAENAVLQSLMPMMNNQMPNYWSPDSKAELELLIQWKDEIIPIEVKAENCISGRSLSVYNDKYHPLHRIRFSFLNLQSNSGLLSCPSPLAEWFWKWI